MGEGGGACEERSEIRGNGCIRRRGGVPSRFRSETPWTKGRACVRSYLSTTSTCVFSPFQTKALYGQLHNPLDFMYTDLIRQTQGELEIDIFSKKDLKVTNILVSERSATFSKQQERSLVFSDRFTRAFFCRSRLPSVYYMMTRRMDNRGLRKLGFWLGGFCGMGKRGGGDVTMARCLEDFCISGVVCSCSWKLEPETSGSKWMTCGFSMWLI